MTFPTSIRIGLGALLVVAGGGVAWWWLAGPNGREEPGPVANDAPPGAVSIVVSGDTAGWIVPCGCTSNQSGGLSRRAAFVASLSDRGPVVIVDAGGAPAGNSPYDREKFEWILRGELAMGLAVHNVGGPEARFGTDRLRDVADRLAVPCVSANLLDGSGERVFPPHRIVEVAGRRIGFVGVLSDDVAVDGASVVDPRRAAIEAVRDIRSNCDTVIVLAHLGETELRDLAAAIPEADAVVGGPTGQSIAPERLGSRLLASATNKGKFVVHLAADEGSHQWTGRSVEIAGDLTEDAEQRANVERFRRALAKRDFSAAETSFGPARTAAWPADYRVAGSAACRDCHAADCEVWDQSGHAHALETLAESGAAADPACQRCHVTGYGLPGGFLSLASSERLGGVGCESCHGPSAAHVRDQSRRTPLVAVDSCRTCHDAENSPEFDYAAYWKRVAHGTAEESP